MDQGIVVLDVGKTHSKLSLWRGGEQLRRLERPNRPNLAGRAPQLDVAGIDAWVLTGLTELARVARIDRIVPVGHGAAGVLIADGAPVAALDYEAEMPAELARAYGAERDPFEATLSPRLPGGQNLGAQLFWLERLFAEIWPGSAEFALWPQYWAWRLSGVLASEVTSLGCHSDLWRPLDRRLSALAERRGWAARLGELRPARDVLGPVLPELAAVTGLPTDCAVHCGLHDSNAALHAARGAAELGGRPFATVSTGTWFVAMRSGGTEAVRYDESEGMLANVDVDGAPVPTARFMGGRDHERLMGGAVGAKGSAEQLALAARGGDAHGSPPSLRATIAALHLARRTDRLLDLVGADGPVLIEGRFAEDPAFRAALAGLRGDQPVFRLGVADGVAAGALRLVGGEGPAPALEPIAPAPDLRQP